MAVSSKHYEIHFNRKYEAQFSQSALTGGFYICICQFSTVQQPRLGIPGSPLSSLQIARKGSNLLAASWSPPLPPPSSSTAHYEYEYRDYCTAVCRVDTRKCHQNI